MHIDKKFSFFLAHVALFVVFFWFGFLKFFGVSPANDLVRELLLVIPIMNMWPFESFIVFLGAVEILIALLMLFPRTTKYGVMILIPHMFTTLLPLFLLPTMVWQQALVPTLAGQYIIKNIVIVALALSVVLEKKSR